MRDALYLYRRYFDISVRSQMQYRGSFLMQSMGQLLGTGIEFLGVWVLFARFGRLQGWTLPEVALLYGMAHVSWAITDAFARGFDTFGNMVKSGDFDRVLLRPRSTALQVAGQEFTLRRVGRFAQGLVVLAWSVAALHLALSPARLALMVCAIAGGACMFYGLVVLQATAAFWTVESLEIFNILTYGGTMTAQYPFSIYRTWFRRFFTFVVPLACVNYIPAHAILGHAGAGFAGLVPWFSPLFGLIFLLVCLRIWRIGERHYCSTGS